MPLMENELARREGDDGVSIRSQPLRVRWELEGLTSRDGHAMRCAFVGSVKALDAPTDRKMLKEVLLDGRRSVFADDVAKHFLPALKSAAAKVVATRDVVAWLEGAQAADAIVQALRKEGNA